MKSLQNGKIWIAMGLLVLLVACAPKRRETEFSKNKAAEAGQTYTEDQLRAAIGSAQYDQLIAGIGADNLNLLTYGVGISNMSQMINGITGPGKLVSLMSDGLNSKKLTALEVLDLLNKLDGACQLANSSFGTDTIGKMVNMINNVSLAGMEGVKNIVHGVQAQASDPNGVPYTSSGTARLGLMISMLNENLSVMPTLVNDLAAPKCSLTAYTTNGACTAAGGTWTPAGVFSAAGNAKLIRLVNEAYDMRDISIIINGTTSLSNITAVMAGLNGNMYCSKPWYTTYGTCNSNGGTWTNTLCSVGGPTWPHTTRAACSFAGGTWTPDGISNMADIINQLNHVCTVAQPNGTACLGAGGTWYSMASKIPVIVNNITNVPNMYTIVNGLTSDGVAYASGTPDGVDTMVASINNIYNASMGDTGAYAIYGTNGTKRLAYLVNQLDPSPQFGNDSDFENGGSCSNTAYETQAACTAGGATWTVNAGFNCTTGNFDNRLNWAFSDNGQGGAPWNGKSFATGGGTVHQGSCSLRNDSTAATTLTATQSAELILNIGTTATPMIFQHSRVNFGGSDVVRFFDNDVLVATFTGNGGFAPYSYNIPTIGIHRFRFDVHRAIGSIGQFFLDTVTVPGTKGAGRTAAEKTYIMMNNLYLANSITNVATLINTVAAPPCVASPFTCTATNDNGLDTLIYVVNRSEYPVSMATIPRLAITVNDITNIVEMTSILDLDLAAGAGINPRSQLVAMMDYIQTPANIPLLVNTLGAGGGSKTAKILYNISAAGTSNMLRILADSPAGVAIADTATLINGATTTAHVGTILTELPLSSNVNIAGTETFFAAPASATGATGGVKLAQFFNRINTVSTANAQNCAVGPTPINSNFCIKNHLVRLVNDVAASTYGPATISAIVGGMRPDTGGPGGSTGVVRMTDAMYSLKTMNATLYIDPLSNSGVDATPGGQEIPTSDQFGRLDTFIADLGATGGATTARMVNEVDYAKITTHVASLIKNTNRIKYLSRFVSELTNVQLIVDILNGSPSVGRVQNLMDDMGDNTANNGNPATKYNVQDDWWATDNDKLGKVITFMNGVVGGSANVVSLLNGVTFNSDADPQKFTVLKDLVKNVHRIRYMTRILNESTGVSLIVSLINASPDATRFGDLVNDFGDQTVSLSYGVATYGGAIYGANPSGTNCAAMPGFANGKGCDVNNTDKLGKVITMLNEITAIQNTVDLMIQSQDFTYVKSLLLGVNRIRYLTNIINQLTNVGLMIKVINGADACTVYQTGVNDTFATDTSLNCATATGTWGGVGRCLTSPGTYTMRKDCTDASYIWRGAELTKLLLLLNRLGDSTQKGAGTKAVGDMFTLYDTMNKLGYNGPTPRAPGQQVRVLRLLNAVQYCGIRDTYDKYIQYGPSCVTANNVAAPDRPAYQHKEACDAALGSGHWLAKSSLSATWQADTTIFFPCDTGVNYTRPTQGPQANGGYYTDGDPKDGRDRLAQAMLEVNDGSAFSVIVGDVQDTIKTINMMNGTRRLRAVTQMVAWMPGPVTAQLVNTVQQPAVLRALVYLVNNLEDDEDEAAKAFSRLIHFGTRFTAVGGQGSTPTGQCIGMPAVGPTRIGKVLNIESGPYLDALMNAVGIDLMIPLLNCAWTADSEENSGAGFCKGVGASYFGNPKPTGTQCIDDKDTSVAGYRYGNYASGANGVTSDVCQSYIPNTVSGTIVFTFSNETDKVIWNSWSIVFGIGYVDDGLSDIWGILQGTATGMIGWAINQSSSNVGFPTPRGFDGGAPLGGAGTSCTSNANNSNNWQCNRQGLINLDLGTGANGYYFGTYCSGAGVTTGTGSTNAQRCYNNGGKWRTQKIFQTTGCKLNPPGDAAIQY